MSKVHRIVISPEAFQALRAESLVKQSAPADIANTIILENISPQAKDILKTLSPIESKARKPRSHEATNPSRPKQLAKDTAALSRIKELWPSGMTVADIARDLGRPRQTVEARIKDMIGRGELAERAESGTKSSGEV